MKKFLLDVLKETKKYLFWSFGGIFAFASVLFILHLAGLG